MERKMSVAEFATLVGTTSKTIYERIKKNDDLPLNEQLETVNEKVKGREVTLINTDSEQIEIYKNIYGKDTVIDGEYYEFVTDNNGNKLDNNSYNTVKNNDNNALTSDIIDRLLTINNDYNERINNVNNELINVHKQLADAKGNLKLLEYKEGREALILNENNDLKKVIKRKETLIKTLITVIITLLIIIITFTTWFITVNIMSNTVNEAPSFENAIQEEIGK